MQVNVELSVGNLYADLVRERQRLKEEKRLQKAMAKESEEAKDQEDGHPLTRKEKRERSLESWKDVIVTLTGDDLEYITPKKNKKKYRKWIDDDADGNVVLTAKPKKKKKTNYNKEFENELSMLKGIVADQNRFTVDLAKRFQTMVGPNTREASPLSKTAVELATAVNNSRSNSLAMIREIGNLKKTIANLTMDELKLAAKNSDGFDTQDMALLGSSIARNNILANVGNPYLNQTVNSPQPSTPNVVPTSTQEFEEFDPSSWQTNLEIDAHTKYENTPKKTIVEYFQKEDRYRYKTINSDTGEELSDYPNPSFKIQAFDIPNKVARDSFNTIYDLHVV